MVVSHREGNISSNIRAIIEQLNLNPTERDRLQQCSNNSSSIKQQQIQQRNNHHIASPMMMRLAPKNNHHRPEPADRPRVTIGVYGLNNHHHNNNNNNNNNNESNMNSSNDSCEPKQWSKKIQYDNVEEYKHEKKVLIRKFEANNNVVDLQVAKKPIKKVNDIGDIENSVNKPQIVTKNNKLDKEMENIIKKAPELRKVLPTKIDNANNKLESFLSKPAWSVKPSSNKIEGILKKPMKKIEDCVNDDQQNDVSVVTKKDVAADDNNLPKKPIWKIDDAKKKVEELSKQIMRKFENNVEEAKVSVINLTQKSNDDDGAKKNNNNNDLRRPLKKIEDKDIKLMSVELVTELQKRKTVHKVVARPRQRQPAANEMVVPVRKILIGVSFWKYFSIY
uniref:WH2 domain-containing protein n=1 Tax=Trichogramma kaykai TaxID=54128 RepID=A0ABD2VWV9_9HYME